MVINNAAETFPFQTISKEDIDALLWSELLAYSKIVLKIFADDGWKQYYAPARKGEISAAVDLVRDCTAELEEHLNH